MQANPARQQGWGGRPPRDPNAPRGGLRRSLSYLGRQRGAVIAAYGALVLATLAQLAVPQLVQNMIDAVTQGVAAADRPSGETLLINAALLIVLFAVIRGIFSFVQAFMAEKTSHGLAFDLRNEIFSKVQRLSFSYYDQNQTGQLMIRATDDVERVRMFIAQGLVLAAQAFLLLIGALAILAITNWQLTLVVLPLLPLALALFMLFGRVSQPLFVAVQIKLSALNTVLQENLAGIKVVRAFAREPYERQRFDRSATGADGTAAARQPGVLVPVPGDLSGGAAGPGGGAVLRRPADPGRHAEPGRVPEVQPVPGLRVLPARPAGLHHLADVAGIRIGQPDL